MTAVSPPLRCVFLYSAGHLGSSLVLNLLLRARQLDIVGVVRAQPAAFSWRNMKKLHAQLGHVGWRFAWLLAWQRVIQFMVFYGLAPLLGSRQFYAAWQLAKRDGIPSLETGSINSERSRYFLHALQPDLIVSAYFSQILKKPVLDIPAKGCLNIHPGFLPDYKGAMNYFWALRNGEDKAGVSVHWMDEGIDTGPVLARQNFVLPPEATQQQALAKSAIVGTRLLHQVLRRLHRDGSVSPLTFEPVEGRYYPVPGREDFSQYFTRRRYFRIRNIVGLVIRKWA